MGLLDFSAPMLGWLDGFATLLWLPAWFRVLGYGLFCAWATTWLYRRSSPQLRLQDLRRELKRLQPLLIDYEGPFKGLVGLIGQQLRLSLKQLGLVMLPSLLGMVPLLFVVPWLSNTFSIAALIEGETLRTCVQPRQQAKSLHWQQATELRPDAAGCWNLVYPGLSAEWMLLDRSDTPVAVLSVPPTANRVEPFHPLNWLIGNPAGYLPSPSTVTKIKLHVADRMIIGFGPRWLRGWETMFLIGLIVGSLYLRHRWKII